MGVGRVGHDAPVAGEERPRRTVPRAASSGAARRPTSPSRPRCRASTGRRPPAARLRGWRRGVPRPPVGSVPGRAPPLGTSPDTNGAVSRRTSRRVRTERPHASTSTVADHRRPASRRPLSSLDGHGDEAVTALRRPRPQGQGEHTVVGGQRSQRTAGEHAPATMVDVSHIVRLERDSYRSARRRPQRTRTGSDDDPVLVEARSSPDDDRRFARHGHPADATGGEQTAALVVRQDLQSGEVEQPAVIGHRPPILRPTTSAAQGRRSRWPTEPPRRPE